MNIEIIENKFECEDTYNSDTRDHYLSYCAAGKAVINGVMIDYDCSFNGQLPTEFSINSGDNVLTMDREGREYKEATGIIKALIEELGFYKFTKTSVHEFLAEAESTEQDIYPSEVLSYSQALASGFKYKDYGTTDVPANFIGVVEYRVWGRSAYIGLYILSEDGKRYRITAYKDREAGEILAPGGLSIRYGIQNGINYRFKTGMTRNKTTKFLGMDLVESLPLGLVLDGG